MIHVIHHTEQFAQKILDGTKKCTIRNPQKYAYLQVGDFLLLTCDRASLVTTEKQVKSVDKIVIDCKSDICYYVDKRADGVRYLYPHREDGFDSAEAFYDYFRPKATDNGIYKALLISW